MLFGRQELRVVDVAVQAGGDQLKLLLRKDLLLVRERPLFEIKLRLIFLHELLRLKLLHEVLLEGAHGPTLVALRLARAFVLLTVGAQVLAHRPRARLPTAVRVLNDHLLVLDSFPQLLLLQQLSLLKVLATRVDVENVRLQLLLPLRVDLGADDLQQRTHRLVLGLPLVRAIPLADSLAIHLDAAQKFQSWVVKVLQLSVRKNVG